MKVVFARSARADIQDIARYIWAIDPGAAVRIVDGIVTSCEGLADMPLRYALLQSRERDGIRRRRHGKYLIFFRVTGETVEILHILHGAMDDDKIIDALD